MMNINSKEAKVETFFDSPAGYLKKRFGIEIRKYITKKLLGEVSNSAILDIGCGDGTISLQYAMRENRLTFVDLSENMLEIARKNSPSSLAKNFGYINADFFEYKPNQLYDVVLCIGVLAHVQSLDFAIKKLYSLLKPGGRCILQFTDQKCLIAKINSLYYSLHRKVRGNPYRYPLLELAHSNVVRASLENGFILAGQCRYSILFPGMGILPDKFLYRYQLFILKHSWLSKYGSEVILQLVKP